MDDNNSLGAKQIDPSEPQPKHNWFVRPVGKMAILLAVVATVLVSVWGLSTVRGSSTGWLEGLPTQMLVVLLFVLSVVYFRDVGWRRLAPAWAIFILGTGLLAAMGVDYAFVWVFQAIGVTAIYVKSQLP